MKIKLQVNQKFVSVNNPNWIEEWRNKTMVVERVEKNYVYSEEFEWFSKDIDWEKTKELNNQVAG